MADQLSDTFAALADPVRRALLSRLTGGEATVNELAEPFPISLQAISKHLKVLERAGLITRRREAQRVYCRLRAAPLEVTAAWIEHHRRHVAARLERLDLLLGELQTDQREEDR